jgi:membrane protein
MAAALSFYTAFSLGPLVVIVIAIAGLFIPDARVDEAVGNEARALLGDSGAALVADMLKSSRTREQAGLAALLALAVLLLGATTAFAELKLSLDDVWGVGGSRREGLWGMIRSRFLSFGLVLVLSFLLLVSLLINTALEMFSSYFASTFGIGTSVALQVSSFAGSLIVVTLLFAAIYKLLPEVRLAWKDVLVGAAITALLFTMGRVLIGRYLGNASSVSVFGAASSLAVLMLWVYYSSMIFLLGAEITKVWWAPAQLRRKDDAAITAPDRQVAGAGQDAETGRDGSNDNRRRYFGSDTGLRGG